MENNHILNAIVQNTPPWVGVVIGHLSQNVTLSNIALLASITYSVVNVWTLLRKKSRGET
jgi:hypothetical protein